MIHWHRCHKCNIHISQKLYDSFSSILPWFIFIYDFLFHKCSPIQFHHYFRDSFSSTILLFIHPFSSIYSFIFMENFINTFMTFSFINNSTIPSFIFTNSFIHFPQHLHDSSPSTSPRPILLPSHLSPFFIHPYLFSLSPSSPSLTLVRGGRGTHSNSSIRVTSHSVTQSSPLLIFIQRRVFFSLFSVSLFLKMHVGYARISVYDTMYKCICINESRKEWMILLYRHTLCMHVCL